MYPIQQIEQMEHEYNGLPPNTKKELLSELTDLKKDYADILKQIENWKKEQNISVEEEENKIMDDCIAVGDKILGNSKGSAGTLQEQSQALLSTDNDVII